MNSTMLCILAPVAFLSLVLTLEPGHASEKELAKTVVLEDCDNFPSFVFSFRAKKKLLAIDASENFDLDVIAGFDILLDLPHGLLANNRKTASFFKGSAGIIDMGRTPLEDVGEAPRKGYQPTLEPKQIVVGHTYCVRASDGEHYGKIHVVKFDPITGPIEFTWQYQPKKTNKFGNTEQTDEREPE